MAIICAECKVEIYCKCHEERDIIPKYRTCFTNSNHYPQAFLDLNTFHELHSCSSECHKKYRNSNPESWTKGLIKISVCYQGKKYSTWYDPKETTKEKAIESLSKNTIF